MTYFSTVDKCCDTEESWTMTSYFQFDMIFSYLSSVFFGTPLSEEAEKNIIMTFARKLCNKSHSDVGQNNIGSNGKTIAELAIAQDNKIVREYLQKATKMQNEDGMTYVVTNQCEGKPYGNYPMYQIGENGEPIFTGY